MEAILSAFPNAVIAVKQLIEGELEFDAGTAAPSSPWTGDPGFYRLRFFGGTDDRFTDRPRFDVDSLCNDEFLAWGMAEKIRQLLLSFPRVTAEGVIGRVTTVTRPHLVPWGASNTVFNVTATYTASLRRNRPN